MSIFTPDLQPFFPTNDDDVLFGSQDADQIPAFNGDDQVFGLGGDDILDGNGLDEPLDDDDQLFGGSGNDNLLGGRGNDHLVGGIGNDTLQGQAGNDELDGGLGNDTFAYNITEGFDTIEDFSREPGDMDRIQVGGQFIRDGITLAQLQTIARSGPNATSNDARIDLGDRGVAALDPDGPGGTNGGELVIDFEQAGFSRGDVLTVEGVNALTPMGVAADVFLI